MAHEALRGHIQLMTDHGAEIPEASTLGTVMADPDNAGAVPFLVAVPMGRSKAVRINITLPEDLLAEIDRASKNRSRFIAEATRLALRNAA